MTIPSSPFDPELFERYLSGGCTAEEREAVAVLAAADRRVAILLQTLRTMPAGPHPIGAPVDGHAAWEQFQHRIADSGTVAVRRIGRWQRSARQTSFRLALAGLSVIGLCVWGVEAHWGSTAKQVAVFRTAPGQRSTVHLADGSTLTLGPATSVTSTAHSVDVMGEVYVIVAPHSGRPYVVQTRNAMTRVLGTQFSVRQYPTERATQVAVLEGRVGVQRVRRSSDEPLSAIASATLSAGMRITVADSGAMKVSSVPVKDADTAWTSGQLVFHDTPITDVAVELSRAYGTTIRVDDALARQTLTWSVPVARRSLAGVLDFLAVTLNAHYTQADHVIRIVPGRAASPKRDLRIHLLTSEGSYGR